MEPTTSQPRKAGRPARTGPGSKGGKGLSLQGIAPRWMSVRQWAYRHGRRHSWGYDQIEAGKVGYAIVNGEKRISDEHDAEFIARNYREVPAAPKGAQAAAEQAAAVVAEAERRVRAKRAERQEGA